MKKILLVLVIAIALLAACSNGEEASPTPRPTQVPQATDPPAPPTATTGPPPTPTPLPLKDINYFENLSLDVYLPEGTDNPFPTILVLHGYAAPKLKYKELALSLAERGHAAVVPNYSKTSEGITNARCALGWAYANADLYGFDSQRIALLGHSGGGLVAASLGAMDTPQEFKGDCPYPLPQSAWVRGVITYGGAFATPEWYLTRKDQPDTFGLLGELLNLSPDETEEIREILLDTPPQEWLEISGVSEGALLLIRALPPAWVNGGEPPFLLIHGDNDDMIDKAESEAFVALLQKAGVDAEVVIIADAGHQSIRLPTGAGQERFEKIYEALDAFLIEVFELD